MGKATQKQKNPPPTPRKVQYPGEESATTTPEWAVVVTVLKQVPGLRAMQSGGGGNWFTFRQVEPPHRQWTLQVTVGVATSPQALQMVADELVLILRRQPGQLALEAPKRSFKQ